MVSPASLAVARVDGAGVHLSASLDTVVDVLFDGRRIWSFWTLRDTVPDTSPYTTPGESGLLAQWPAQLRRYLDGHTALAVVEHVSGREVYAAEVSLGTSQEPIAVVDATGRPLGIDKSNRIAATFDTRNPDQVAPLLDSTERVLTAVHAAGVEAFLAYGTLLGAVREQNLIGHDSDVDLGYVSRHTHPLDVIRESYRLQRDLRERGFDVDRYSAAAFKVDVVEGDGGVRGLDVFGGYFLDGRLYLMGEIGTPFQEDWVFPLGTCTLVGRSWPAPARPEKMLEATYGPSWKVPDPAFHFETPRTTRRRLNGWFRGGRINRADWDRRYSGGRDVLPQADPSPLARHVAGAGPERVVDVGSGRGGDALWLARQGVATVALDYSRKAPTAVRHAAEKEGLPLDVGWMNLHELRSVISQGARIARMQGTPTLMANHLVDALDSRGVEELARFARMALCGGGRLYADFDALEPGELPTSGPRGVQRPVATQRVVETLRAAGAVILQETRVSRGNGSGESERPATRLVAEWRR